MGVRPRVPLCRFAFKEMTRMVRDPELSFAEAIRTALAEAVTAPTKAVIAPAKPVIAPPPQTAPQNKQQRQLPPNISTHKYTARFLQRQTSRTQTQLFKRKHQTQGKARKTNSRLGGTTKVHMPGRFLWFRSSGNLFSVILFALAACFKITIVFACVAFSAAKSCSVPARGNLRR